MAIANFLKHVNDPAPGFRCYAAMDDSETPGFTATVANSLNPPAEAKDLARIQAILGSVATDYEELYRVHDGILLYEEPRGGLTGGFIDRNAGIEFFPVSQWKDKSDEMRFGLLESGWEEEDITDWIATGVVFAEICRSANYFLVIPDGPRAGEIHYLQHDEFSEVPVARDLKAFLDRLIIDPAAFLFDMGCYTRYSDGQTKTQWIPKVYISDLQAQ